MSYIAVSQSNTENLIFVLYEETKSHRKAGRETLICLVHWLEFKLDQAWEFIIKKNKGVMFLGSASLQKNTWVLQPLPAC